MPAIQSSTFGQGDLTAPPTLTSLSPAAGANRVAVVAVMWERGANATPEDVDTIAWGGNSFSRLAATFYSSDATSTHNAISLWYLLDADFPASASNLTTTMAAGNIGNNMGVIFVQMTGAAQAAPPAPSSATGSSPLSVNVTTTVADSLILDAISNGQEPTTPTANSGQTIVEETTIGSISSAVLERDVSSVATYSQSVGISADLRFCLSSFAIAPPDAGNRRRRLIMGAG